MAPTYRRIEGLGPDWRQNGRGQAQQMLTEVIGVGYSFNEIHDPKKLAKELLKFADKCKDAEVDVSHDYDSGGLYGCDVELELTGWVDKSELEVNRAKERARAQKRTDDSRRRRELEAELAKLK